MEVETSGGRYTVHIHNKTCDCREWQVTGIPCIHATVAIVQIGIDLESMVDEVYTTEMYKKCYDLAINPIVEYKFWEKSNENINVYPPVFKKQSGRPKKKRYRGRYETDPYVKIVKCSKCGKLGHNKKGCRPTRNDGKTSGNVNVGASCI